MLPRFTPLALRALRATFTLRARIALSALRAWGTCVSLNTLRTLWTWVALRAFWALRAGQRFQLFSGKVGIGERVAFFSLRACFTSGALYTLLSLGASVAFVSFITFVSFVAFCALFALRPLRPLKAASILPFFAIIPIDASPNQVGIALCRAGHSLFQLLQRRINPHPHNRVALFAFQAFQPVFLCPLKSMLYSNSISRQICPARNWIIVKNHGPHLHASAGL